MRRERPTVVLVFAILNMVFGGLGVLCYLCSGLQVAFQQAMAGGAPGGNPTADMQEYLAAQVPGYTVYLVGSVGAGLLLSILLIVAGLGLLGMRTWARWLCVAFSVTLVLVTAAELVFVFAAVQPALQRWAQLEEQKLFPGRAPGGTLSIMVWGNAIGSVFGAVIEVGYAVGVLIVMFLPGVSAAFAGKSVRRLDDEAYDDYEEDVDDEDDEDDRDDREAARR